MINNEMDFRSSMPNCAGSSTFHMPFFTKKPQSPPSKIDKSDSNQDLFARQTSAVLRNVAVVGGRVIVLTNRTTKKFERIINAANSVNWSNISYS